MVGATVFVTYTALCHLPGRGGNACNLPVSQQPICTLHAESSGVAQLTISETEHTVSVTNVSLSGSWTTGTSCNLNTLESEVGEILDSKLRSALSGLPVADC